MTRIFVFIFSALSRACLPVLVLALLAAAPAAAQTAFVYPAKESPYDVRYDDLVELLSTALEKTAQEYGPFTLSPAEAPLNEAHQLFALKRGERLNVMWTSTSVAKEEELLPVRIPLRKGLLGYRVCLISKDKQEALESVSTVEDLRKLVIGQGAGWGDVTVYEANGIPVLTADYDSLFKMTANGRFDLFPRGIGEVYREFEARAAEDPGLAVDRRLTIHYPWPYYFFFNRKDAALAERVEKGLRIMLRDGTFEAIFQKYNKDALAKADLKNRRVIRIINPLLPKQTPLEDRALWYTP